MLGVYDEKDFNKFYSYKEFEFEFWIDYDIDFDYDKWEELVNGEDEEDLEESKSDKVPASVRRLLDLINGERARKFGYKLLPNENTLAIGGVKFAMTKEQYRKLKGLGITDGIEESVDISEETSKAEFIRKPRYYETIEDFKDELINHPTGEFTPYIVKETVKKNIKTFDDIDNIAEKSKVVGGGTPEDIKTVQVIKVISDDGIYLIDKEGYDYARYLSFIPNNGIKESKTDGDFDARWEDNFGSDNLPKIMSAEDTIAELKRMEEFN